MKLQGFDLVCTETSYISYITNCIALSFHAPCYFKFSFCLSFLHTFGQSCLFALQILPLHDTDGITVLRRLSSYF